MPKSSQKQHGSEGRPHILQRSHSDASARSAASSKSSGSNESTVPIADAVSVRSPVADALSAESPRNTESHAVAPAPAAQAPLASKRDRSSSVSSDDNAADWDSIFPIQRVRPPLTYTAATAALSGKPRNRIGTLVSDNESEASPPPKIARKKYSPPPPQAVAIPGGSRKEAIRQAVAACAGSTTTLYKPQPARPAPAQQAANPVAGMLRTLYKMRNQLPGDSRTYNVSKATIKKYEQMQQQETLRKIAEAAGSLPASRVAAKSMIPSKVANNVIPK